jgi:hypothetical protein
MSKPSLSGLLKKPGEARPPAGEQRGPVFSSSPLSRHSATAAPGPATIAVTPPEVTAAPEYDRSARLTVRMPKTMHKQLALLKIETGSEMGELVVAAVEEYLQCRQAAMP